MFGAEAVIKSLALFTEPAGVASWEDLLKLIFEVITKKTWLSEECGWILFDAVQRLKAHPAGTAYIQTLINTLNAGGFVKTPEGVALWIAINRDFPAVKLPKHVFHHRDPLNSKELKTLANILRESGSSADGDEKSKLPPKGNWSPRLHVAWEVVFEACTEEVPGRVRFSKLWREAVDGLPLIPLT